MTDAHPPEHDPIGEQAQLADMLVSISERMRAVGDALHAGSSMGSDAVLHLSRPEIDDFLTSLVGGCREEMLSAQPQVDRNAAALATALVRDIAALERGVRIRTLYQHSARHSAVEQQYVDRVAPLGAEVRTLEEFFDRMIIIDRRTAVLPGPEGTASAVAVRDVAVVRFLASTFDRVWERGRPFTASDEETVREIAEDRRAMAIRLLIEGHPDDSAARRMGVSPRTYASYVADLRKEYGAGTRFQLGYTLGRLGVSANQEPAD